VHENAGENVVSGLERAIQARCCMPGRYAALRLADYALSSQRYAKHLFRPPSACSV